MGNSLMTTIFFVPTTAPIPPPTVAPVSLAPVTTDAPTSLRPVSLAPVTVAPTFLRPVSSPPVSLSPLSTVPGTSSEKTNQALDADLLVPLEPRNFESYRESTITMYDEGQVVDDALRLVRYKFGPDISAKGPNAVVYYEGYIFVTHYSGGMDQRYVRLSRKRMGDPLAPWITIVFPHQHVLFRKDKGLPENERRGDSHNTISLGISPEDGKMHLLYDMHAYTPSDFPNDYFNYCVSVSQGSVVPDSQFSLDLFQPKQTFLNPSVNRAEYQTVSYPTFLLSPSKKLLVTFRTGGSTNARMKISRYENGKWGAPVAWNANSDNMGIYGQFKEFNGKLIMAWQRRHKSDAASGYSLNRGIHIATSSSDDGSGAWYTDDGERVSAPLRDLNMFKVGEPCQPGERMLNAGGATLSYVVSRSGAFHMHATVDGRQRHCFRARPGDALDCSDDDVDWRTLTMHYIGDRIYRIGLFQSKPIIQSTEPGTNNWRDEYRATSSVRYTNTVTTLAGANTILLVGMELMAGDVDARPMHVFRFEVGPATNAL